ncbi:phage tail protein [Stenotrophomonas rhizophila]|jgi:microcystin-dependent protein|uniref:phage tail protein n=1 Tax=Stenotrophomonas rhizophila TaxID=216778 RepID=UPI0028A97228|nr:tail fiber protein [Stenotrophomonas rhizophila]
MSNPYVGEIRLLPFTFAPVGWQDCNGALLSIAENDVLFNLIGTTYGGDGVNTFAVPDLRGRLPVHQGAFPGGSQRVLGSVAGSETVTLQLTQLPAHGHTMVATDAAASAQTPSTSTVLGAVSGDTMYTSDISGVANRALATTMLSPSGGNQPHENLMPTLTLRYCISLFGIYPSQS